MGLLVKQISLFLWCVHLCLCWTGLIEKAKAFLQAWVLQGVKNMNHFIHMSDPTGISGTALLSGVTHALKSLRSPYIYSNSGEKSGILSKRKSHIYSQWLKVLIKHPAFLSFKDAVRENTTINVNFLFCLWFHMHRNALLQKLSMLGSWLYIFILNYYFSIVLSVATAFGHPWVLTVTSKELLWRENRSMWAR